MKTYKTLKRCAGVHNFAPGESIDLPADEAKLLLADHAIAEADDDDDDSSDDAGDDKKPSARRSKKTD